jgi:hypothetical protein
MMSNFFGTLFGRVDGLRMPESAKSRSQHIGLMVVLSALLYCSAWPSYAAENLECPEIGPGRVPDLIGDTTGAGLITSGNRSDLANEINVLIYRLQISNPNIPWTDVQNVLIAAYCRVVTTAPGLTASEKWNRMRQFDRVLEQQIAAHTMPAGTLIIANVPLPPDVFRELRSQAFASHQTPAQLMAAILARAAGK